MFNHRQDQAERSRYEAAEALQRKADAISAQHRESRLRAARERRQAEHEASQKARLDKVFAKYDRQPIMASSTAPTTSNATSLWRQAVAEAKASGMPSNQAVIAANKRNPGLRQAMLAEVNG